MDREFDLLISGCTGYTGGLITNYLAKQINGKKCNLEKLRWAIGGRDAKKVEKVRESLKEKYPNAHLPEVVRLDPSCADAEAFAATVGRSKVLISAVGPYALHGEAAVRACVEQRTHYVDVTGENRWVAEMIAKYGERARANRVVLLPCSGWDFTVNDVMMAQLFGLAHADEVRVGPVTHTMKATTRGFSGGTLASLMQHLNVLSPCKAVAQTFVADVYTMNPEARANISTATWLSNSTLVPHFDPRLRSWCTPWAMTPLMAQYVNWANKCHGYRWGGEDLVYHSGLPAKNFLAALMGTLAFYMGQLFVLLLAYGPKALQNKLLVPRGSGPAQDPANDYVLCHIVSDFASKKNPHARRTLKLTWNMKGLEAYAYTAAAVSETALELLAESDNLTEFGILPPSKALNLDGLVKRYSTHLGIEISSEENAEGSASSRRKDL